MKHFRHILCLCLMALMASQSLWTGQMRMAQKSSAGVNLLCGIPSVPLSVEAKTALREISELLGKDVGQQDVPDIEHCPDCVMASYDMVVPAMPLHIAAKNIVAIHQDGLCATRYAHSCNGPPLGSRAPPLTL